MKQAVCQEVLHLGCLLEPLGNLHQTNYIRIRRRGLQAKEFLKLPRWFQPPNAGAHWVLVLGWLHKNHLGNFWRCRFLGSIPRDSGLFGLDGVSAGVSHGSSSVGRKVIPLLSSCIQNKAGGGETGFNVQTPESKSGARETRLPSGGPSLVGSQTRAVWRWNCHTLTRGSRKCWEVSGRWKRTERGDQDLLWVGRAWLGGDRGPGARLKKLTAGRS